MATALALGRQPNPMTLVLSPGSNFSTTLRSQDAGGAAVDWPVGSTLRLVITDGDDVRESWDWTIDGSLARLTITAAEVNALPKETLRSQLWLDYGDGEFLWCSGSVSRYA